MELNINNERIQKILLPMMDILEEKNIIEGISIVIENDKLFVCIDRNCLSETNQKIIEKISFVYSETLIYTDNKENPNLDRLEYWCPDEEYDERTHITERCRSKKTIALELDLYDEFTILGTSIMLANAFQEQDPLSLEINREKTVFHENVIERHEHYIASGCPDLRWISLNVFLNKDNSLRQNPYAPFMGLCEINSSVLCDNLILTVLAGYNEKIYIIFNMEKENLEKVICEYFEKKFSTDDEKTILLNGVKKRMLKN